MFPETVPASPGSATPPRLVERLLTAAARWQVAVPVVLCCVALVSWSLGFRLPASERLLKVRARAPQPAGRTNPPVTAAEVSAMREQVRERSANLLRTRKEIPPLLSRLDARARELGWRCDGTLKPPVPAPGGVRELTLHPLSIDLSYDSVQPERAYQHLLAWLWTASTLQPRPEVTFLKLQSLGQGLNAAQVELNFFSLNSNEDHPPK
jgi:hypothetical protein